MVEAFRVGFKIGGLRGVYNPKPCTLNLNPFYFSGSGGWARPGDAVGVSAG